jgi:5-methylcytosine-specific restriction endonuclease McrA
MADKAELIESYGGAIRSVRLSVKLPSVLRLNHFVRVKRREVPLTKRNILRRDGGTCQYCGRRQPAMTTDHIIPRAMDGTDTWENLVCACPECNAAKGNRTPAQARMALKHKPKKPHFFAFAVGAMGEVPDVWRQYLFLS